MRSPESAWLIRDAEIGGVQLDCRIRDGFVVELGHGLGGGAETALDAAGRALLPGLADHHLHVFALAALARSFDLAGATDLRTAVDASTPAAWLRIVGAGREFDRAELDSAWPDRPVRVQHRSGALWMLNSAAIALLSDLTPDERRTGQLWRDDVRLRRLLADAGELADPTPGIASVGRQLLAQGITHLTDASPDLDAASLERLRDTLDQHLLSLSGPGTGPRKIVVADHDLPDPDVLADQVAAQHGDGRPVAIHAVTAAALALALAAFDAAGAIEGDRVEHAAVCTDQAARRLADLGVAVVTQPSVFARHGRRFLDESDADERRFLWRYGGLRAAGLTVVPSSDAPYGDTDPWLSMRQAAGRGDESVEPAVTLDGYLADPSDLGRARRVAVGSPADLVLLTAPLTSAVTDAAPVAATFVDGGA